MSVMNWQSRSMHKDLSEAADKILSAALNYIAKRDYSIDGLRTKLKARGADELKTEEVLAQLIKQGYLDDSRYARAYVRHRREFRPCGLLLIKKDLRAQKIDIEVIEQALAEEFSEQQQREVLDKLIEKEMSKDTDDLTYENNKKAREKTIRRLVTKGFSMSMILAEMEKMGKLQDLGDKFSIDSSC